MKKEISIEELKEIQLIILDAVHQFCIEHNIMYSLSCGTLLGAIRHKGYIPWDDDIDIYMLRNDYEKFLSIFPKKYKGRFNAISLSTNHSYALPFAKVEDSETILIEKGIIGTEIGVNIDIFPIDGIPVDEDKRKKLLYKINLLKHLLSMKKTVNRKGRSVVKTIYLNGIKLLLLFISQRVISKNIDKLASSFSIQECDKIFELVSGMQYPQGFFNKDSFLETIDWPFEDRTFKVMSGYDDCLTACFHDYMQLPPLEKRVTHHAFKAYLK